MVTKDGDQRPSQKSPNDNNGNRAWYGYQQGPIWNHENSS
jgi:hypothetical protein